MQPVRFPAVMAPMANGTPKPSIVMPVGIPGIGKSTLIQQQMAQAPATRISRDDIRTEINGGDATFIPKTEPKVAAEALQRFKDALTNAISGGPTTIALDATHADVASRRPYLNILQEFSQKHPVLLKIFHFPNDVALALQRQAGRVRQVEQAIIEGCSKRFLKFNPSELQNPKAQISVEVYDVSADGTVTPQSKAQP